MPTVLPIRDMDPSQVLHLEASLVKDRVRISMAVQRAGEIQTVRQVEEFSVSMSQIDRRCSRMLDSLNQANRRGQLPPDIQARLAECGQLFRDELFSNTIKERLTQDTTEALVLTLDDQLVHIPWELLHDGQQFLGQRFAMGRVVRTRQPVVSIPLRTLTPPLRMLILADPCGDLRAAYDEGIYIRDLTESRPAQIQVTFRSTGVQTNFLKAKLRQYDLIHFAGHADFSDSNSLENGWRLGNGRLTAGNILRMAGTGSMPTLVFANACQSARSGPRPPRQDVQTRFFDMANAFLISGVKHYLGTFWEIPDEQSRYFALSFYESLFEGASVGAAVLAARRKIMACFGEQNIVWAGYLLYGDPTSTYFRPAAGGQSEQPIQTDAKRQQSAVTMAGVRGPEDRLHLSGTAQRLLWKRWLWGTAALFLLAAATGLWLTKDGLGPGENHEQKALAAFQAGQYDQVKQICGLLQRKQPKRSLGYVLMANVHFFDGDLANAHALYQQAILADQGSAIDKADAYIGLGRIASVRGNMDEALAFYHKAALLAPDNEGPLVAQALLKDRTGHPDQAVELLNKAKPMASDTQTIESLTLQFQANADLAADQQHQARIDRLIRELVAQMETDAPAADQPILPRNSQTLTLWLNELETVGYSLREGTSTLITSGLMERLLKTRRIQIVERALLDGLMSEIKLGTSRLADPQTQLQLGRLTAARLILTGRVVHNAPAVQVTLRCIETDTGQVFAVVNAHFDGQTPIAGMVEHLADELISKIYAKYPLVSESKQQD